MLEYLWTLAELYPEFVNYVRVCYKKAAQGQDVEQNEQFKRNVSKCGYFRAAFRTPQGKEFSMLCRLNNCEEFASSALTVTRHTQFLYT